MRKEKFCDLIDSEVTEKLSSFKIKYPRSVLDMCVHPTGSNEHSFACCFSKRKNKMLISNADKDGMKLVVVARL